jgi:small subunit ribosomal protein S3
VSAGGGRRLADGETTETEGDVPAALIKEADPELERLLAEEEEIERLTKAAEHSETPHFRGDD